MNQNTAFITGADRGLGLALTARLLELGWHVFAGRYLEDWHELDDLKNRFGEALSVVPLDVSSEESVEAAAGKVKKTSVGIDLLVNNAGASSPSLSLSIRDGLDYGEMLRLYKINAMGPLRMVEAFLPLMDKSRLKRLCFVSSEAGSIEKSGRKEWFCYCMSKAALNMGIKNLFNALRPEGYTFRVYHPGWIRSYLSGVKNLKADLEPEEAAVPAVNFFLNDLLRGQSHDEDKLVLYDYHGAVWPW
ncbi:MAG: SDR family NAD(P)-dependent oxidoreductase [Spirochaetales bacterium]|nr:SDR family NAD(P)-dependent oxidoreductase [Spirochaetales bacterium]